MAQFEHASQVAYFNWARLHPEARRAYAIPNAAKRTMRMAAYMKAEGLRKGVLDIHLPIARGGCHGLWIELKHGNNDLTPEQRAEAERLANDGFCVLACWDSETAIRWTTAYLSGVVAPGFTSLKPSRASLAGAKSKR